MEELSKHWRKLEKKPHHLKWAHITNINMMTMNVISRRVRMNNAWPDLQSSEWKAASWKLRCLNTWSQFEPQLSLKKNIYNLVFCWFFVNNSSELWISRVRRDVWQCRGVNMENIKSYLQLCNYSRLFSSFILALLKLNTVSICNNAHTSTYKNTSVQSHKHFS